jgi:hypothetical protein
MCWDINPGYPSALAAWQAQKPEWRHPGDRNVPPGALVYFSGGQYGHATFSAGGNHIYSTDILRRGKVDLVTIETIERKWGLKYLGWTDHQGAKIVLPVGKKPAPVAKTAASSYPLPASHAFGPIASATVHNGSARRSDALAIMRIQRKFRGLPMTGFYGRLTTRKVRAWQLRRAMPPTGRVGRREWSRLGL